MRTDSPPAPAIATPLAAWQLWARWLYLLAAVLVASAVVVQVFLAGAAVLHDPAYWGAHRSWGNTIELFIVALLLIGLLTRLPWRLQALGAALYPLMFLQYAFLYLMPLLGAPILRGLHAVNALALFGVAVMLTRRVWRELRA